MLTILDDINIYYEVYGEGVPLILISGYTCDHTFWNCIVEELAKQYKVVVFDNRAIGRTKDSGVPFTIETMADDVITLSRMLGLINPYIVGQSMGGAVAQTIARKYPGQIKKLIIVNSVMKFNIVSLTALDTILKIRKLNVPFDVAIESSLPWIFSSDYLETENNIDNFKKSIADNLYGQSVEDQERQLTALRQFDSSGWIATLHTPTMVIAAQSDILALPMESQALATAIPNALFKIIPGGHASPVEQPTILGETISSFFKE